MHCSSWQRAFGELRSLCAESEYVKIELIKDAEQSLIRNYESLYRLVMNVWRSIWYVINAGRIHFNFARIDC